jgi:hypothetical protein
VLKEQEITMVRVQKGYSKYKARAKDYRRDVGSLTQQIRTMEELVTQKDIESKNFQSE